MSVHACLCTWSQRVRRGPHFSLLGISPRLPLLWYVRYCMEIELGFLIVDTAPDFLELHFLYTFAPRSTFDSTLLSSTPSLTSMLSFGTVKPFDPVVHSGFLTSPTATVWRTRQRRIHAVLGRNPRSQRLWIFPVRAQGETIDQPSGCNVSESELSGKRPGERLVFKRLEAEEASNSTSSTSCLPFQSAALGYAATLRVTSQWCTGVGDGISTDSFSNLWCLSTL